MFSPSHRRGCAISCLNTCEDLPPRSGCIFAVFHTKTILNEQAAQERTERGYGYEDEKPPVPPSVEDITGNDNEEVLQEQLVLAAAECVVEHKPIEQEHYRQENGKLNGVEKHNSINAFVNNMYESGYTFMLQRYENYARWANEIPIYIIMGWYM